MPLMTRLTASKAQEEFADTLDRVVEGERVVVRKGKRDVAAIVPMEDLELIEAIEDYLDHKAAREAMADAEAKGEKPIPLEEARKLIEL